MGPQELQKTHWIVHAYLQVQSSAKNLFRDIGFGISLQELPEISYADNKQSKQEKKCIKYFILHFWKHRGKKKKNSAWNDWQC